MTILGFDCSTSCCGWAFSTDGIVQDAGFIDISKKETTKEKAFLVIETLKNHPLTPQINHINLETALLGFNHGKSKQQIIIKLIRLNAIFEYIISEYWKKPVNLLNVSTMRKKVLGKARIKLPNSKKNMPSKDFVKQELPKVVPNLSKFDKMNTKNRWNKKNSDTYDAIIASLFG